MTLQSQLRDLGWGEGQAASERGATIRGQPLGESWIPVG